MKAIITGSSGFIGSRLCNYLEQQGHSVIKVSRKPKQNSRTDLICDIESSKLHNGAMSGVNILFHLAGYAHDFSNSEKFRKKYFKLNIDATRNLALQAAREGVKAFIFVSSVKAGGFVANGKCMTEKDQEKPDGIYGKTKREAELNLLEIGKESSMHVSIIRSSLVYGPNAKGNLQLMLSGIKKGWFPPLAETGNRRSMIHVDDLVRAILLVADDDRANGEIFIATDGTPYSSREIYDAMCKVLGKPSSKWSVPKIFFDLAGLASSRIKYKINKLLGDECYSSAKLEALGFKAQKSLKDMNETDY